ncbi:MAG: aryl-alcohol dehydrogenase [Geobacteraceae bacterium]|nr:aryl-alcohol dehydrogenase [Geobacteraceae bacterium]
MKIGLGTVQFGLDYGISNRAGQTSCDEAAQILKIAWDYGIDVIDTAALYGTSEQVIGQSVPPCSDFKIITKTPSFGADEILSHHLQELERIFDRSLCDLARPSVYGLLAHNANDLLAINGREIFRTMEQLKASGRVEKIGVSAYSPQQVDAIIDQFPIDLIQIPINILDQRLISGGQLINLKRHGVEIHARSAFLQGLLLTSPDSLPEYFSSIRPLLHRFQQLIKKEEITSLQASLAFLSQSGEIDRVICGVNNSTQLMELCAAASTISTIDFSQFAITDESILNPSSWIV